MPHVAVAALASKKCLQPPAMSKSQAKGTIYLQRVSGALGRALERHWMDHENSYCHSEELFSTRTIC